MTTNTRLSPSGPFIAPDALTADGVELSIGAVADGQVLKRVGDEIVGVAPSGVTVITDAGGVLSNAGDAFATLAGAPAFGTHLLFVQGVLFLNSTSIVTAQFRDAIGSTVGQPIAERIDPASTDDIRSFSLGPIVVSGDPNGYDIFLTDAGNVSVVQDLALTCVSFP